jgi:hypothetical protein
MIRFNIGVDKATECLELLDVLKKCLANVLPPMYQVPVPIQCTGVTGPPIYYMPDGATTYYVTFMTCQDTLGNLWLVPYVSLNQPQSTNPIAYAGNMSTVYFETDGVPCPQGDPNPNTDFFYETATITDPNSGQDVRHRVGDAQLQSPPGGSDDVYESELNPPIYYSVTLQGGASAPDVVFPVYYRYRRIRDTTVAGPVDLFLQQPL